MYKHHITQVVRYYNMILLRNIVGFSMHRSMPVGVMGKRTTGQVASENNIFEEAAS